MSFEVFHPDNEFVKSEKPEYKKGEEARGELVGGDTPDKKLEGDNDKNKEDLSKQKISYIHKPNEQEMQRTMHEKEEATKLVSGLDNDPWPPISIESHVGGTEGGKNVESSMVGK